MELDELKMAWGQFNDKINGQELVGRQQLKQMLAKKKMSNYSRLLWYPHPASGSPSHTGGRAARRRDRWSDPRRS